MDLVQLLKSKKDEKGHIQWPADERECEELAQTIFGLLFIECFDGWVKTAEDWLKNEKPSQPYVREWSDLAKMDRNYRSVFHTLNEDQRKMVSRLLRHAISGALFSSLASIDQFSEGAFEITFVENDIGKRVVLAPGWNCLHDRFYEWRRQYSMYPCDEE